MNYCNIFVILYTHERNEFMFKEMTMKEALDFLIEERNRVFAEENNSEKIECLDKLVKKAELLKDESVEDRVSLGSLVELEITNNSKTDHATYYLDKEYGMVSISMYSPLGLEIFGLLVGSSVSYDVNGNKVRATIVSKVNEKEEIKEEVKVPQLTNN